MIETKNLKRLERSKLEYIETLQVSQNFDLELAKYDGLTRRDLINLEAYPFGGFVRDAYHNNNSDDLDLFFPDKYYLKNFAKFLKTKGWKRKSRGKTSFLAEDSIYIVIAHSNYVLSFKKGKYKIDLFYYKDSFPVSRVQLPLLSSAYLWDIINGGLCVWVSPMEDIDIEISFKKKEIIPNHLFSPIRHEQPHRKIISNYLKDKIISLYQKGWKIRLDRLIYQVHSLPVISTNPSECYLDNTHIEIDDFTKILKVIKKSDLIRLIYQNLTHRDSKIRTYASWLTRQQNSESFYHHFYEFLTKLQIFSKILI